MKYHLLSRIFHWVMAILIIFMIGFGIYMTDFISDENTNHLAIYELHKSIGVLVLILLIARIINRLYHKPPALPESIKNFEKKIAYLAHLGFYFLMLIVPLSGYLMSNFYGFEVKIFGIILPNLTSQNIDLAKIFSEIHEISAFSLTGLILLHISAVFKHRFFDQKQNDVLKRML